MLTSILLVKIILSVFIKSSYFTYYSRIMSYIDIDNLVINPRNVRVYIYFDWTRDCFQRLP